MHEHTVTVPDEYWARLQALAAARKKTPEECLLDMIAASQPGGGGWVPPAKGAPFREHTLPDACFLLIEPGPPAVRHFPVRNEDGSLSEMRLKRAADGLTLYWEGYPKRNALLTEVKGLLDFMSKA